MEQQIWTAFTCFWLAILGAVLGSFFHCAVSRWAAGEAPFLGRSRCVSCGHTLGAGDLVPVFSFLLRRGRCRYCGERIPAGCLLAELAGAGMMGCLALRFGPSPELGQWAVCGAILLALSVTDAMKRIILDGLVALLLANRAAWAVLLGCGAEELMTMAAACLVPAALLVLVVLAEKALGREVMGGGGIKLLFALALYLSWAELLLTLLAGCLLGLGWAGLARRGRSAALPFGPFLTAGAMVTVCFGAPVLEWYFGLF